MGTRDHAIPERDARGLRMFALEVAAVIAGLFGLALPWLAGRPFPWWPWAVAGVLVVWGLAAPTSLGPVYRTWMRFGLLLNRVVSPVVLGVIFFVVLTPIGFVMRLTGRDRMARRSAPGTATFRVESHRRARDHMERPF